MSTQEKWKVFLQLMGDNDNSNIFSDDISPNDECEHKTSGSLVLYIY